MTRRSGRPTTRVDTAIAALPEAGHRSHLAPGFFSWDDAAAALAGDPDQAGRPPFRPPEESPQ